MTHLGHHIPASLEPQDAYQVVEEELDQALHQLHNRPIPFHGRIRVANQNLIPKLTYRLEHLPPQVPTLDPMTDKIRDFVLAVGGALPRFTVDKTIYRGKAHGVGLAHFRTAVVTRVLDAAQKAVGEERMQSLVANQAGKEDCFEWLLRKGAEAAGAHTIHNPPPRTAQMMASITDFLTRDSEGHQDHDLGI